MSKKIKQLPEPSEEFEEALSNSGSILVDCQLCGRTHFTDANPNYFEKGELEEVMKKYKQNPDKYVYHSEDNITWGYINGKQAVIDCSCNKLSLYEKLFWNSRYIIEDYFTARAEKELKDAKSNKTLADKVRKTIDSIK